jgi:FixJ family two-component response regulator
MPTRPLIAIVDDDQSIRDTTQDLLESAGLSAVAFDSAHAFLASELLSRVTLVIADMRMPAMSGLELHQQLVASGSGIRTILITAYPDEGVRTRAAKAGVMAYLAKPFSGTEVLACIRSAGCAA